MPLIITSISAQCPLRKGSILDEIELKRVFFEEPQIVFHPAALFANQNSIDHPESDLLVNGLGTLKLLQYARMTRVQRFAYASSGCSIYGSKAPLPLKEDFVSINLSSPYWDKIEASASFGPGMSSAVRGYK